jgi:hypothetical protein
MSVLKRVPESVLLMTMLLFFNIFNKADSFVENSIALFFCFLTVWFILSVVELIADYHSSN